MGKEMNAKHYDKELRDLHIHEHRWYDLYEEASKFLPPPSQCKTIELGCGVGGFAELLYNKGYREYIGIDFSAYGIKTCKKRVPDFKFIQANILDLSTQKKVRKNNSAVVVVLEVLEHINKDLVLISSIPEGRTIVFSVPSFDYNSHVRFFNNMEEVKGRYKNLLEFQEEKIVKKREKLNQKMFLFKTVRL